MENLRTGISMNDHDRWSIWKEFIIPGVVIFGPLLYFVGRRYTETYFAATGIPSYMLKFEPGDFVYQGAHPIRILIVLCFTLLGIGLYKFITSKYIIERPQQSPKKTIWARARDFSKTKEYLNVTFIVGFFAYYAIALLVLMPIEIFGGKPNVAIEFSILICVIISGVLGAMILFDQRILPIIKCSRWMRRAILWGGAVVLFLFPYITAGAYGTLNGTIDTSQQRIGQVFPNIVLTAQQPANKAIKWQKQDTGLFQTQDTLYLLLFNDGRLFIRSESQYDKTIIIDIDIISSFAVGLPAP